MSKGQCLECQEIIESKHRNDFVRCSCGNSFLDGGNEYIRAGGTIAIFDGEERMSPMELFLEDSEPVVILNRNDAIVKMLEDVDMNDVFDDGYLDDDFDDYNLGVQAGTMDERERILRGIQKLEDQSNATRTPLYQETMFAKIRKIVNGQVG